MTFLLLILSCFLIVPTSEATILIRRIAAAGCSGTYATDTFTEAGSGNVNLNTHTADTGQTWNGTNAGDGSLVVDRTNDNLRNTLADGILKLAYLSGTLSCSNYDVAADLTTHSTSSTNRASVVGRYDSATGNGYVVTLDGTGAIALARFDAGAATTIASGTIAGFSSTTTYTITLRMSGSTISCLVNGVSNCSATDATYSAAGTVGVRIRNNNPTIDNLAATYL